MLVVVSNIAFAAALLAGLLGFVEWLLPKSAKQKLKDGTTAAWIWLAEQSSQPYGRFLTRPAARVVLVLLGLIPIVLAAWVVSQAVLMVGGDNQDFYRLVGTAGVVAVAAALAAAFLLRRVFGRLITWTIEGRPIIWIAKALLISAAAFAVLCVPFLFYLDFIDLIGALPFWAGIAFFVLLFFVYSLALVLFGGYALMFLSVAVYAVIALLLLVLFKVFALIFDRISSSEKGVLAGLVVALTVIGTIARTWKG